MATFGAGRIQSAACMRLGGCGVVDGGEQEINLGSDVWEG